MFYTRFGPGAFIWISTPAGSCRLNLDQVAQAAGESWQGTFSGTLHSTMDSGKPLTITDGHFTVLRTE